MNAVYIVGLLLIILSIYANHIQATTGNPIDVYDLCSICRRGNETELCRCQPIKEYANNFFVGGIMLYSTALVMMFWGVVLHFREQRK